VLLVVGFRSSSALAGAYGIAISATMLIDGLLVIMLLRFTRAPNAGFKISALTVVAVLDVLFFASNSLKFASGGWIPIATAAIIYVIATTWQEGRRTLNWLIAKEQIPAREFVKLLEKSSPHRVVGTAVYLASEAEGMPRPLLNNLKFNHVLHERNLILTFARPEVPYVAAKDRIEVQQLAPMITRITARYGFMESPDVVHALRAAENEGVAYQPEETIYVVGRENPVFAVGSGMPQWRKRLFAFMGRNSQLAATFYGAPPHRTLEVSNQIKF
jgi:KUP system potassium uptake protein